MTRYCRSSCGTLFAASILAAAAVPAQAQNATAGQLATSSAGLTGQRQEQTQPIANIKPMARIDGRIQSRVQSRIQSRIDRNYNPPKDAASSVAAASNQLQNNARTPR